VCTRQEYCRHGNAGISYKHWLLVSNAKLNSNFFTYSIGNIENSINMYHHHHSYHITHNCWLYIVSLCAVLNLISTEVAEDNQELGDNLEEAAVAVVVEDILVVGDTEAVAAEDRLQDIPVEEDADTVVVDSKLVEGRQG